MIIFKKAISRRTVLRGMGGAVALPLLDAMIPALTAAREHAGQAAPPPRRRLPSERGDLRQVAAQGRRRGVRAVADPCSRSNRSAIKLIVVTGLYSDQAEALGDGGGDHSRASGTYLTGVHVRKSDSAVENGVSMDQIAARALENETQLSSLQLTVDENSLVGPCDIGYGCAYSSTLSWLTPTLPLMAENNPRVVFQRLFGSSDSTDPRVRTSRLTRDQEPARFGHRPPAPASAEARDRRTTGR